MACAGIRDFTVRHRPGRLAALVVGVLVAAVGFVLLLSAARTGELQVRGTIARNFRGAYDILVRPPGSYTPLERERHLVRDNYLSGIYGGITMRQYQIVRSIPGVAVAAPIANIGYVMPFTNVPISIRSALTVAPYQLYRLRFSWNANGGLSRYPDRTTAYVYYTRRDRFVAAGHGERSGIDEARPGNGRLLPTCGGAYDLAPQSSYFAPQFYTDCFSAHSPRLSIKLNGYYGQPPQFVGTDKSAAFPMALAAIDPVQEARLVGLNRAVTSGRYLRNSDRPSVHKHRVTGPNGYVEGVRYLPAIASSLTYVSDTLDVSVQRLRVPTGVDLPAALAAHACTSFVASPCQSYFPRPPGRPRFSAPRFLAGLGGPVVKHRSIPIRNVYGRLLRGDPTHPNSVDVGAYWTGSPVRYRQLGLDRLQALPTPSRNDVWNSEYSLQVDVPPDNRDVQYRSLIQHDGSNQYNSQNVQETPWLRIVGRFDTHRLAGFNPVSRVPLETYYPPRVTAANAATRRALHGRPLLPSQNLGGYLAQPPLLLTTLRLMHTYLDPQVFTNVQKHGPISVIRVRVGGVHGDDALSRARIRTAATLIHERTGLAVDITAGSSPQELTVALPAGRFGQPPLLVREGWTEKGVAVRFLEAVDRKSIVLFGLILVVCTLFVANGALAGVRTRRTEIGVLMCLGWSASRIFAAVVTELAIVGVVAGATGALLAAVLVETLSLHFRLADTLLVVPVAVGSCTLAGLVPAWRAARGAPLDAVRPPIVAATRARRVHTVAGMAVVNLMRVPARTLLGCAGLVIGVAALTVLVAIDRAFSGTLVGSLLGSVISVQVRSADRISVVMTVVLAGLSVADVVYLNLRERAAELATLRTSGWSDAQLSRLVITEAALLGATGGFTGALVGIGVGRGLLGLPITPLLQAAALGVAGSVLICIIAALLPTLMLSRMTAPTILAAE